MKKSKSAIFVIGLFLFGCATFSQESQDAFLTNRGAEEISKGNYEAAEANLKVALELNAENSYALFHLGQLYESTRRVEKARQMYQKVIDLNMANVSGQSPIEREQGKNLVEIAQDSLARLDAPISGGAHVMDSDGDGVENSRDKCPDTPMGATVDERGCWVLTGVSFDSEKWKIEPQFFPFLERVVIILKKNPHLKLEIQGHSDNRGSSEYNAQISRNRARAVIQYLVKEGIEKGRLRAVGYGSSKPVRSNATPDGSLTEIHVALRGTC